jgi:alanine racemase
MYRQTAAQIDLAAIRSNYELACTLTGSRKCIAVIKANAYGHGMLEVAQALDSAAALAVATVDEACTLRDAGIDKDILVLEGASSEAAATEARGTNLVLMVNNEEQVDFSSGTRAWIKVDTGMHRLGIGPTRFGDVFERLRAAGSDVLAACTHLACADDLRSKATEQQLQLFGECTADTGLPLSIANSAGILAWPASHADWNRPGIMLYGASPFPVRIENATRLRPAMTFRAEIIALRAVEIGESVGYGARWTADRRSRIATVAAGYADGYPRHAQDGTPTFVRGRTAPLAGMVSMDMITIDVTDIPDAVVGDQVELWGHNVPVNDVAAHAGTVGYQLLTGVSPRVPRTYDTSDQKVSVTFR